MVAMQANQLLLLVLGRFNSTREHDALLLKRALILARFTINQIVCCPLNKVFSLDIKQWRTQGGRGEGGRGLIPP